MKFTILGATGVIGSRLRYFLLQKGYDVYVPSRGDLSIQTRHLGHVIYCIGITADFRRKPFETVGAHISVLSELLAHASFDSFLYLSSTRVYLGAMSTDETADCCVNVNRQDDFYNLTKLTGESLCLVSGRKNVRIARLSNVFSADQSSENFLSEIIRAALIQKRLELHTSLDSGKDYISMTDALMLLTKIAVSGQQRLYNVASGINISNRSLVEHLSKITGCEVHVAIDAPTILFPPISVARISGEFFYPTHSVLDELPQIVFDFEGI